MRKIAWFLVAVVALAACGDATAIPDAAEVDGSVADAGADAMPGEPCMADDDCEDGVFCNGTSRCRPLDPEADARGCTHAGAGCLEGQECSEEMRRCVTTVCDGPTADADGDGVRSIDCSGTDCDDSNALRYPGNAEVCDAENRDEDCDPTTFGIRDGDADGEPDSRCCNTGDLGTTCGSDCDDSRAGINPRVPEVCNGLDDDCDDGTDEAVTVELYRDADGDLHGDATTSMRGCPDSMSGWVIEATDCDDTRADFHPSAVDRCDDHVPPWDEDCSGVPNDPPGGCDCTIGMARPCAASGICAAGVESCVDGRYGTCSITPEAFETCDGEDDDCNGTIDDGLRRDCWVDADADGYAASGARLSAECTIPGGRCPGGFTERAPIGGAIDCADTSSARSPAVGELCNSVDDDCDSRADEGLTVVCYADRDNDTFAATGASAMDRCPDASRTTVGLCPIGFTNRPPVAAASRDCNDDPAMGGSTFYPGALESCDGLDNDCNGTVDDGSRVRCFTDGDDDGYAASGAMSMMVCRVPGRESRGGCPAGSTFRDPSAAMSSDCNDGDPTTYPTATELCGFGDNNCNGSTTDEVRLTCYSDADNDTYAPAGATAIAPMPCPVLGREVVGGCPVNSTNRTPATASDCNDTAATVHPGALEMCDEPGFTDSNCNGGADENTVTCWLDSDDDGRPPLGTFSTVKCRIAARIGEPYRGCPLGFTGRSPAEDADCNDSDRSRWTIVGCYPDGDDDSFRRAGAGIVNRCYDGSAPLAGCNTHETSRTDPADCCDGNPNVNPGQTMYFTSPRSGACEIGGPAYDYDCSGGEEQAYTSLADETGCAVPISECGGASGSPGWIGAPPTCGAYGSYYDGSCHVIGVPRDFECVGAEASSARQSCR